MYTCSDLFAFSGFEMKKKRKKKKDAYVQQGLKLTLSNSGTKTLGKTTLQVLFNISISILVGESQ